MAFKRMRQGAQALHERFGVFGDEDQYIGKEFLKVFLLLGINGIGVRKQVGDASCKHVAEHLRDH